MIDCFQTKTVPIYIGCENIGEFFDIRGIIHVKTLEELKESLKQINEQTYQSMLEFVDINFEESMKYKDHRARIESEITSFLETL